VSHGTHPEGCLQSHPHERPACRAEIFPPAASEPAEGRADEARAHDLELPRDLARQLLRLRPARGVLAPGDRDERRLDEPELALRGRPEAAQVPRLDARTLQ